VSIECRYCEHDARHGHADDCVYGQLQDAKALLSEGERGFGRVLIATSDDKAARDWQKRCRKFLRRTNQSKG
jgi:hypothetical protein